MPSLYPMMANISHPAQVPSLFFLFQQLCVGTPRSIKIYWTIFKLSGIKSIPVCFTTITTLYLQNFFIWQSFSFSVISVTIFIKCLLRIHFWSHQGEGFSSLGVLIFFLFYSFFYFNIFMLYMLVLRKNVQISNLTLYR